MLAIAMITPVYQPTEKSSGEHLSADVEYRSKRKDTCMGFRKLRRGIEKELGYHHIASPSDP